jgi:hypothetical protein
MNRDRVSLFLQGNNPVIVRIDPNRVRLQGIQPGLNTKYKLPLTQEIVRRNIPELATRALILFSRWWTKYSHHYKPLWSGVPNRMHYAGRRKGRVTG